MLYYIFYTRDLPFSTVINFPIDSLAMSAYSRRRGQGNKELQHSSCKILYCICQILRLLTLILVLPCTGLFFAASWYFM